MTAQHHRVIRVLEWYEKEGVDLVGEVALPTLTLSVLEGLFGVQKDDPFFYNKYEVLPAHAEVLQGFTTVTIELDNYAYLVACYASDS
ncbi:MAG: hypothetical protein R2834_05620 [Rhodothermales bacterium]